MRAADALAVILTYLISGTAEACDPSNYLDFLDLFSGAGGLASGLRACGFVGLQQDFSLHHQFDLLSARGFLLALSALRRVRPFGVCHCGPPCGSWVWISRASTGRRSWRVRGLDVPSVRMANLLVRRLCLLLTYAVKRNIQVIVEQPLSSLLFDFPPFKRLVSRFGFVSVSAHMGFYGAPTLKPTRLVGSALFLPDLAQKCGVLHRRRLAAASARLGLQVVKKRQVAGRTRVDGGRSLKGTQQYPIGYGVSVGAAWTQSMEHIDMATEWSKRTRDVDLEFSDDGSSGDEGVLDEVINGYF